MSGTVSDASDELLTLRENAAELFDPDGPGGFRDEREEEYFTFTGTDIPGYVDDVHLHGVSFTRQLERTTELDTNLEELSTQREYEGVSIEASDTPRDMEQRTLCIYGDPMDRRVVKLTEYIPFDTPVITVIEFRNAVRPYLDDVAAFNSVFFENVTPLSGE